MKPFLVLLRWNLRWERARLAALALAAGIFLGLLVGLSDVIRPAEMQEFSAKLPPAFQSMANLKIGQEFTPDSWIAIAHSHPLWLVLVLTFPLHFGVAAFARRIEDGSLETILAEPISRTTYYLSAAASLAAGTLAVVAVSTAGGLIGPRLVHLPSTIPPGRFLAHAASGASLALAVGGISLAASATLGGRGRPGAWTLGAVVVFFFVEYLSRIWSRFAWAGRLSLFHYHAPHQIARDGLAIWNVAVLLGTALLSCALGLVAFRRRALSF